MLFAATATFVHADALSDAFAQGQALGGSGNSAAHKNLTTGTASTTVPHYATTPAETAYFGSGGLGSAAAAATTSCASTSGGGYTDQACAAVTFSQKNPSLHPSFTIAPSDPLLTGAKTITADPQAIAGNIAGNYGACTVHTVSDPDRFETQICHQYPALDQVSCQKLLTVQVVWSDSCVPGTWFGNFWVNTWGNGEVGHRYAGIAIDAYCQAGATVRLRFKAICTESPCSGNADITVDAVSGAVAPQTFTDFIGRSWYDTDIFNRVDYKGGGCGADQCSFDFCTRYEAGSCGKFACGGTTGSVTRACGTFTFDRPRSIATVTDAWDNQCASFEARLP